MLAAQPIVESGGKRIQGSCTSDCQVLTSPCIGANNRGWDNAQGHYILKKHDHIVDGDARYEILEVLGAGEYGQVVRCRVSGTAEEVAIKVIRNTRAHMYQSMMEVRIIELLQKRYKGDLASTAFVNLKSHFMFRGHLCLVLELLGLNLLELLKRNHHKGLSLVLVRVFVQQLLRALCDLHALNVVHGDIKLENILLCDFSSTRIKLVDFGSSSFDVDIPHFAPASCIQSRHYRAPEVLLGKPYDRLIDVWSVGCVAAELYLGRPLFPGSNDCDQIQHIAAVLGMPVQFTHDHEWSHSNDHAQRCSETLDYRVKKLDDLVHVPLDRSLGESDRQRVLQERKAFVHFLSGLLQCEPDKRWSPDHALRHPFITGVPFTNSPHVDERRQPRDQKAQARPRSTTPHQGTSSLCASTGPCIMMVSKHPLREASGQLPSIDSNTAVNVLRMYASETQTGTGRTSNMQQHNRRTGYPQRRTNADRSDSIYRSVQERAPDQCSNRSGREQINLHLGSSPRRLHHQWQRSISISNDAVSPIRSQQGQQSRSRTLSYRQ